MLKVRKFFVKKEFLSTQKMTLPQKQAHGDESNDQANEVWIQVKVLALPKPLLWIDFSLKNPDPQ